MREDTPELRAQLDERLARATASKEAAITLMNALAEYTEGKIISDRHAFSDTWHLDIDQHAAGDLLNTVRRMDAVPKPTALTVERLTEAIEYAGQTGQIRASDVARVALGWLNLEEETEL